jgi:hypothetical protein
MWWLLLACGAHTSGGRVEETPLETWSGSGVAVAVPAGARVALDQALHVDASDGSRWFDVRWVAAPETASSAIDVWVAATCETVSWSAPASPIPGTATRDGLCSIGGRRHWLLAVAETRGDRTLLTMYAADSQWLTFEDAWVDAVRTALTLGPAPSPLATRSPADVRAAIRDAAAHGGVGREPIPGGGKLGASVSDALTDVWALRASAPPPAFP